MEVKGHEVEEEGGLGGKGYWGELMEEKMRKGYNSLPRSRSLFSIQMEVVFDLTTSLR